MRLQFQKQSALKLVSRIIPQFTVGFIFFLLKDQLFRQAFQKLFFKKNYEIVSIPRFVILCSSKGRNSQ